MAEEVRDGIEEDELLRAVATLLLFRASGFGFRVQEDEVLRGIAIALMFPSDGEGGGEEGRKETSERKEAKGVPKPDRHTTGEIDETKTLLRSWGLGSRVWFRV